MTTTFDKSMYIKQLPSDLQITVSHILHESISDMCLTHEESEEAYNNGLNGRIRDLSDTLRYGEILAALNISGMQIFGEVELMVTYCDSFPVVTFYDWLVANDYTEEEWDNDELIDNFLDFCNDWGLEQSDF